MTTINDVWIAYEEAHGRWSGCNWSTRYGRVGMDLNGVSSSRAHQAATRWREIASAGVGDHKVAAGDESDLVHMARYLGLGRGVVCRGASPDGGLSSLGSPGVRSCANVLAWE
jgi:hypothetical protein